VEGGDAVSAVVLFPFKCQTCEGETLHFPSDTPGSGKEIYLCRACNRIYEVFADTGEVVVNERIR
jgi:hypothetical protein